MGRASSCLKRFNQLYTEVFYRTCSLHFKHFLNNLKYPLCSSAPSFMKREHNPTYIIKATHFSKSIRQTYQLFVWVSFCTNYILLSFQFWLTLISPPRPSVVTDRARLGLTVSLRDVIASIYYRTCSLYVCSCECLYDCLYE